MLVCAYVLLDCFSIENSWSGQHAYEWHCGSHTPNKEYDEQAPPSAWPRPPENQWVSVKTSVMNDGRLLAHLRQSSVKQHFPEYQNLVSELSNSLCMINVCCRITLHTPMRCLHTSTQILSPAAPSTRNTTTPHLHSLIEEGGWTESPCLSHHSQVYTYTLYTYMLFVFTYIYISMRSLSSRKCTDILLPPWQERGRSGCSSSCSRCSRRHRCEAASGGCSRPPARSSFPRKTRST